MSEKLLEEQISLLSAKVTALTMFVETLWVEQLARDENPALTSKIIIDKLFQTDGTVREKIVIPLTLRRFLKR